MIEVISKFGRGVFVRNISCFWFRHENELDASHLLFRLRDRRERSCCFWCAGADGRDTGRHTAGGDSRVPSVVRSVEHAASGMESAESLGGVARECVYGFVGWGLYRQLHGYGEDTVFIAEFSGTGSVGAAFAAFAATSVLRVWIHACYGRELSGMEAAGIAAVSSSVVVAAGHLDGGELWWLRVHRGKYENESGGSAPRNEALNFARVR